VRGGEEFRPNWWGHAQRKRGRRTLCARLRLLRSAKVWRPHCFQLNSLAWAIPRLRSRSLSYGRSATIRSFSAISLGSFGLQYTAASPQTSCSEGTPDATTGQARFYRSAVCLLFPSSYEGFGVPALEAMAHAVFNTVGEPNYPAAAMRHYQTGVFESAVACSDHDERQLHLFIDEGYRINRTLRVFPPGLGANP
jgi:glycosyltransferase involved in cell wall biosynthesis